MKKQLLILMTLFTVLIGHTQTFNALDNNNNSLEFDITSATTVEVKAYISGGTDIDIPLTVSHNSVTYNVTSIGDSAFENVGLTSAVMPNTITSIGIGAFAENQLNNIALFDGLTDIEIYAFGGNQLTNITIPNSVSSIGSSAFINNQLTSLTLSNNLSIIEFNTFKNNQLVSISIPNNITDIEEGAFSDNQLTDVALSAGIVTIGTLAFNNNMITNISLPDSVTTIGNSAFYGNQITSVTIPESVTNIFPGAFNDNPLTDVTSLAIVPAMISTFANLTDSFAADRSNIHLHIPVGTMGAYVTDSGALWTGFNPVTEDALSVSDFELANNIKVITTANNIKVISPDMVRLQNYALYNISGQKIITGKAHEITTTTFTNGIYILKLQFDKGLVVKKVLIN